MTSVREPFSHTSTVYVIRLMWWHREKLFQHSSDDCMFVPLWESARWKWLVEEPWDERRQQLAQLVHDPHRTASSWYVFLWAVPIIFLTCSGVSVENEMFWCGTVDVDRRTASTSFRNICLSLFACVVKLLKLLTKLLWLGVACWVIHCWSRSDDRIHFGRSIRIFCYCGKQEIKAKVSHIHLLT